MLIPQMSSYEFRCPNCKTGLNLPRTVEFELPKGNYKCLITRTAGSISCPNCGVLYKLKKIWDYGTVKIEVYEDGNLEPCFVKIYKKAKVK